MNRISSRIALVGVGAVLFAAGVAGCGGSDDDSGEALSKDDFIAQANEICAGVNEDLDSLESDFTEASDSGDSEAAADVLRDGTDILAAGVEELKGLTPPEEDQDTIDEWLALNDEQAEASDDLIDAVADEDNAKAEATGKELDDLAAEADPIADEYGFTECGSDA